MPKLKSVIAGLAMGTALTGGVVSAGAATATSANAATNVSNAPTAAVLAGCFRESRCGWGWGRSWGHRWGGCHRRCGWGGSWGRGWGWNRGWGWRRHDSSPRVKVVIHNSNHNSNHNTDHHS